MLLPVASLFTASYKPASATWTVVRIVILFNSSNEYTSKLKIFGVIKVDFCKCDRKDTTTGMHISLIEVWNVYSLPCNFISKWELVFQMGITQ